MPDDECIPFKETDISLSEAIKISASLCAQVSYRKADESLDKAIKIHDRLVKSIPVHASPFEHQATPTKSNIVTVFWRYKEVATNCRYHRI